VVSEQLEQVKPVEITFLMKNLKNSLYNHHHGAPLIAPSTPVSLNFAVKYQEIKVSYPYFSRIIHF